MLCSGCHLFSLLGTTVSIQYILILVNSAPTSWTTPESILHISKCGKPPWEAKAASFRRAAFIGSGCRELAPSLSEVALCIHCVSAVVCLRPWSSNHWRRSFLRPYSPTSCRNNLDTT